ncbi:UbiA family prenyltransferase [Streptomyces sp. NPDC086023]|uniref:UbiA family prenyltransferase n=1 Tax=Streptomyces sp. NPDC086023 TaxID=3365746 RepID=UPI0037CEEB3F
MPATTDEGAAEAAGLAAAASGPSGSALLRGAGGLLGASHPVPAAGVTLLAALLAAASGLGFRTGATAVAAVAAGQFSVGWSNDRLDLRRDRAAGRRDKPLAVGGVRPAAVSAAASAALLACVPLSLACGARAGLVHLGCVAAAWAYNLWLKRTPASWLPYALAFGLLPAFLTLAAAPGRWPPPWLTAAAALLGTAAHFANTLPDIDADLAAGVRGLPQRLGRRGSVAVASVLAFGSGAVLAFGPPGPVTPAGRLLLLLTAVLSLGAVAASPALARSRMPFLAVLALAGADAVLLVLASRGLAAP